MSQTHWQQIEELFARAVNLSPDERHRLLDQATADDPALRAQVERLLAADERDAISGDFLEQAVGAELTNYCHDSTPIFAGRQLGPWRIEDRLGDGGMSTVYRARRADQQFDMQVAVKLIKWGLDGDEMRKRFEVERRILAHLEHPNIARLLDAGSTDEGLPYFVMEYIDGVAIDRYCDDRFLGIDERLELFDKVCAATAYAHRNLIVHRDLKPGNILVTAEGVPKLLDFGIAKLLGPVLTTHHDVHTAPHQMLLTPTFASPEQFLGEAITTASDVYALGVLLYDLLCGRRPYRLTGRTPSEAEKIVREQLPALPSEALTAPSLASDGSDGSNGNDGSTAEEVSRLRGLRPDQLQRRLRGDLDRIVLMALRKEPERRYASASQLAGDLERHRQGLPVTARADTLTYRGGKFLRRHRLGMTIASLLVVVTLGFMVMLSVQSLRLARERDAAERERERVERVSEFMTGIYQANEETVFLIEQTTVPELLDHGARRAYAELAEEPEILYRVLEGIARRWQQLGGNDRALPLLRDALELRRRTLGDEDPAVADSLNSLAITYAELGQYAEAESLFRQALELRRKIFGSENLHVASSLNNLALVRHDRGDYRGAEPLYRESLALYERLFGTEDLEVAATLDNLGLLLFDLGAFAEAEPVLSRSFELRRRHLGERRPDPAHSMMLLGAVRARLPPRNDGEDLIRQAVKLQRELLGIDHPEVPRALQRLAEVVLRRGDLDEAEALYREALELRRAQLGEAHPEVAASLTGIARVLALQDPLTAETYFRQAIDLYRRTLSPDHPELADAITGQALLWLKTDRHEAALPLLREALDIRRRALRPDDARIAEIETLLKHHGRKRHAD